MSGFTSSIDPRVPEHGNPTTESVRRNFEVARAEITELWNRVSALALNSPYLSLAGGEMTGALVLAGDPTEDMEAVPRRYIDGEGGQPIDGGTF
jgi:hypothetical protein